MRRIVVTGGAGFVGSHLCEELLRRGEQVIAVDNLVTGTLDNIAHLQNDERFSYMNHDIIEPMTIDGKVDCILQFASPASPIDYLKLPLETLKVGSYGTHNALDLAREHGATILFASTSEVYGDPRVNPQPEEYWGNVNSIGPRSVYDEAKRYSEAAVMAYHRTYGVDTRIVRIFNTYGPRMRIDDGRVVPTFISQALRGEDLTVFGDGSQTRSFCYVDDLVDGILRLMNSQFHEPVNIGNRAETTVLQFAHEIIELTESKSHIIHEALPTDDPQQRQPDINRAQTELGWTPSIPREEGLRRTIAYFSDKI